MFEKLIYENLVAELTGWAILRNRNEEKLWEDRKSAWLQMADIARSKEEPWPDKPAPPAREMRVLTVEGSTDQNTVSVVLGPGLVAEPTCELAPIASYEAAAFPQGVTAIGPYAGFGDIWVALPQDTIADGIVVGHVVSGNPINLRKTERRGFGNLRLSFYTLVK
jgi:hypothetical protein